MFTSKKTRESIEKDLVQYEKRRTLEIDEELSQYRRQEKNRSLEEVKSYQDSRIETAKARAAEEASHNAKKLALEVEIAQLNGEATARKAVEETQKIHRKLTEDARNETRDAQVKAAEDTVKTYATTIEYLKTLVTTLMTSQGKTNTDVVTALGAAAAKDHATKVIGLGLTAVNAEKSK